MGLINCLAKLSSGKNKAIFSADLKSELHARVAELRKTMPEVEVERTAVKEALQDARDNYADVKKEIIKQLKIEEKKPEEPLKAQEKPGNEPIPEEEAEPPSGSPTGRTDSTIERASSAAHDYADRIFGAQGHGIITNVTTAIRKAVRSTEFLHSLVARAAPHMPSAKLWHDALMKKESTKGHVERMFENVSSLADKLTDKQRLDAGDYMARSSIAQKWGHQPENLKRQVVIDPEWKAKFDALDKKQQALVDEVFTTHENIADIEQKLMEANGAQGIFAARNRLDGPYVHLDRKGEYLAVLKSKEYEAAEAASNKKALETLRTDPKHYQVVGFRTSGQADTFVRENKSKFAFSGWSHKMPQLETRNTMNPQVLQRLESAMRVDSRMDPAAKKAMLDSIKSMYLSTLDANSARQASRMREGIEGWDRDVVATALSHGRSKASYISNIAHGAEISDAFNGMKGEIEHPVTKQRVGQDDFDMLAAHHVRSLEYKPTPIQDGVVALTSAWQLATSISYHLANFSQVVMFTLPRLAADFGSGKYMTAWGHVMDGYKQMREITNDKGMSIDLTKVEDPKLREALEHATDLQLLDVGMTEDLKHFDKFETGYAAVDGTSAVAAKAIHKLRRISSAVERWNRVSSATASYNMAREHGKSHAEAMDYMINILRDTQGDFTHTGAPLLLKAMPKVMGQYKKFQLMSAAYYVKAFDSAFLGATPAEKAMGRRLLVFKLSHTAVASGVLGLPMMNVAALVYDALNDGPDKLEDKLLNTGNKDTTQMLQHGLPSLFGFDASAKLGEENIFSILPYTKFDVSSKTGLATTAAGLAGPSFGLAGRMASGLGLIQQGDLYKGTEKLVPKGLETAMQSFRLANEGYTMKNGDLLVKPEDISMFSKLLTAAGLPSAEVKHLGDQERKQYEITKYFMDESRKLEHEYIRASKDKDQVAMTELRAKWMDLQKSKDDQKEHFKQMPDVLKHQPLSTMLGAPQRAAQREQKHQREFAG